MPNQATAHAIEPGIVGRLAKFFPEATPVRIPIKLSHSQGNGSASSVERKNEDESVFIQDTIIEFGTPREVLFAVDCPLQFADHVFVESKDRALYAEASVVAVQYHPERTVVAVRFLKPVPNWIVKS